MGERNMIKNGWRWDVIADFPGNSCGVRVAIRKTKRGAARFAKLFYKRNRPHVECVFTKLRHDPSLDEVMNKRSTVKSDIPREDLQEEEEQETMSENLKKAAKKRALVAINHLEKARAELDAACSDLSSVVGANAVHNQLRKLSNSIIDIRRQLDREANGAYAKDPWFLDHEPTPQELHCGHGPKHGCGRGSRKIS